MAQKRELRTPSGSAGLIRMDEKEDSLIQVKPEHVVFIILGVLTLEIFLMFIPI